MRNNLDYPFFNNQGENDQRIHINYTFSNCIKEYQGLVTYSDFYILFQWLLEMQFQ